MIISLFSLTPTYFASHQPTGDKVCLRITLNQPPQSLLQIPTPMCITFA